MADFSKGDRIVKMSGVAAGKYGTVNSVREDGTLNVTFDGERLSRFCDPERCGKVAANAKFKVGDRVKYTGRDILIYGKPGSVGTIKSVDTDWFGGYPIYEVEFPGARLTDSIGEERLTLANSRVCNAVARNGLSPYGAVSGLLALKWYDKKENKNGGVMIVRAPFEAVKRYLEQSARNYPYKIAPYGRGWAKVTAPFEW